MVRGHLRVGKVFLEGLSLKPELTNIVNAEVEITVTNRASVKIRRSIRATICAALAAIRRRRKREAKAGTNNPMPRR
jgi:hypothetical protein